MNTVVYEKCTQGFPNGDLENNPESTTAMSMGDGLLLRPVCSFGISLAKFHYPSNRKVLLGSRRQRGKSYQVRLLAFFSLEMHIIILIGLLRKQFRK